MKAASPFEAMESNLLYFGGSMACLVVFMIMGWVISRPRKEADTANGSKKGETVASTMIANSNSDSGIPSLFLSGFGAIYVMSFLSYWLQYPGLFGNDGLGPSEAMWEAVAAQRTGTSDAPFDLPILGSLSLGEGLQAAVRNYMAFPSLVRFNPSLFGNMPVDIFMEGSSLSPLSCPLAPPQPLLSPP